MSDWPETGTTIPSTERRPLDIDALKRRVRKTKRLTSPDPIEYDKVEGHRGYRSEFFFYCLCMAVVAYLEFLVFTEKDIIPGAVFTAEMIHASTAGFLVATFCGWFTYVWGPIPPATSTPQPGVRASVYGTIISSQSEVEHPSGHGTCVAWSANDLADDYRTDRMSHSAPFSLKTPDGRVLKVVLPIPSSKNLGRFDIKLKPTRQQSRSMEEWLEDVKEQYPKPYRMGASCQRYDEFAIFNVGDKITIAGYFVQKEVTDTPVGYRELRTQEYYTVLRRRDISLLPPSPTLREGWQRKLDEDDIIMFRGKRRDQYRPLAPVALEAWRLSAGATLVWTMLMSIIFAFIEVTIN